MKTIRWWLFGKRKLRRVARYVMDQPYALFGPPSSVSAFLAYTDAQLIFHDRGVR